MTPSLPTDPSLPLSDAPDSLIDVLAAVVLDLATAGAILAGGFFLFFCSF